MAVLISAPHIKDEECRSKKNSDVIKVRDEEWERKPLEKRWIIPNFYDFTLSDFLPLRIALRATVLEALLLIMLNASVRQK